MKHYNRGALGFCLVMVVALPVVHARQQPPYAARQTGDIITLQDAKAQTTVSLKPSAGNVTFEMLVKGQNVLNFSGGSPDTFKGGLTGIPFVGPWANRLDEQAFYANGKKYAFDMQLGNVRGAIPIHGLGLSQTDQWQVVEMNADAHSAWVTSKLDFYKNPAWIKQFPFAHTVEMTHRLQDGVLQVTTRITNHSIDPMPVAVGFHPYFQLTDTPRSDWTIAIGAKTHWLLASNKVPTGETEPIEKMFPDPKNIALKNYDLDDVYGDLVRDASGRATMTVKGTKTQQVDVILGANWRSVVVWAPDAAVAARNAAAAASSPPPPAAPSPAPNPTVPQTAGASPSAGRGGRGGPQGPRHFVCFEPMAGITDAMNLAQKGLYKELQSIPPGGVWQESFWIRPSGY